MRQVCFLLLLPVVSCLAEANAPARGRGGDAGMSAAIAFTLADDSHVALAVYDVKGVVVRTLACGDMQSKGAHTMPWDGCARDGGVTRARPAFLGGGATLSGEFELAACRQGILLLHHSIVDGKLAKVAVGQ